MLALLAMAACLSAAAPAVNGQVLEIGGVGYAVECEKDGARRATVESNSAFADLDGHQRYDLRRLTRIAVAFRVIAPPAPAVESFEAHAEDGWIRIRHRQDERAEGACLRSVTLDVARPAGMLRGIEVDWGAEPVARKTFSADFNGIWVREIYADPPRWIRNLHLRQSGGLICGRYQSIRRAQAPDTGTVWGTAANGYADLRFVSDGSRAGKARRVAAMESLGRNGDMLFRCCKRAGGKSVPDLDAPRYDFYDETIFPDYDGRPAASTALAFRADTLKLCEAFAAR